MSAPIAIAQADLLTVRQMADVILSAGKYIDVTEKILILRGFTPSDVTRLRKAAEAMAAMQRVAVIQSVVQSGEQAA